MKQITVTLSTEAEAAIMAYLKDDFTNVMASRAYKSHAKDAALNAIAKAITASHYQEMANDAQSN